VLSAIDLTRQEGGGCRRHGPSVSGKAPEANSFNHPESLDGGEIFSSKENMSASTPLHKPNAADTESLAKARADDPIGMVFQFPPPTHFTSV